METECNVVFQVRMIIVFEVLGVSTFPRSGLSSMHALMAQNSCRFFLSSVVHQKVEFIPGSPSGEVLRSPVQWGQYDVCNRLAL